MFNETFYVNAYYGRVLIDRKLVQNLAPSAERLMVFAWNTSGVFPLKYVISCSGRQSRWRNSLVGQHLCRRNGDDFTVPTFLPDVGLVDHLHSDNLRRLGRGNTAVPRNGPGQNAPKKTTKSNLHGHSSSTHLERFINGFSFNRFFGFLMD